MTGLSHHVVDGLALTVNEASAVLSLLEVDADAVLEHSNPVYAANVLSGAAKLAHALTGMFERSDTDAARSAVAQLREIGGASIARLDQVRARIASGEES